MEVIINSSPLISFAILDRLHLLNDLFEKVFIASVKSELDLLIKNKIGISESLYNKALVLSNEIY
ncbi:MAG: hypothetical protein WC557_00925 [Ignavibacteriaceae bacterium]